MFQEFDTFFLFIIGNIFVIEECRVDVVVIVFLVFNIGFLVFGFLRFQEFDTLILFIISFVMYINQNEDVFVIEIVVGIVFLVFNIGGLGFSGSKTLFLGIIGNNNFIVMYIKQDEDFFVIEESYFEVERREIIDFLEYLDE